jgi:sigma-B regulation protein RsbU (phosphoserine phosphatase)
MSNQDIDRELDQLRTENYRLRMAVEELSILNEIATAITSTMDLDRVVELIVQKCVKHLKVEQGAVWLLGENEQGAPLQTMVRKLDSVSNGLPFRLDAQVTGWMLKNQKPLLVNDFLTDERFQITKGENLSIHSLLAVPLQQKGKMIGLLTVFNKRGEEGFTDDDRRLLTIIAAQSAQIIEAARLYLEEQQLQRMQQDMNLAKEIQFNLLPKTVPEIRGYDAYGISIPAKEVGGDYYDFITIEDDKVALCLGDVSGKGMPAALLMANLQATLRGQTMACVCARECLERSNHLLYHSTDAEKYATLFYGILNLKNHMLCFANAGHNNPFLVSKDGKVERLKTIGIPLGFMEEFDFSEHSVSFEPGDTMVLFSDGISEAMNAFEEEFEEERLLQVIKEGSQLTMRDLVDEIISAVSKYTGDTPQTDDMTLLAVKRNV